MRYRNHHSQVEFSQPALLLATIVLPGIILSGCDRLNATGATSLDGLARLTAVEEMRIGDFNDPNIGFSRVAGVDIDADGNLFVLESSVPEIRVYSPEGHLLRRIGRRGGGPGEFEGAPRFGVIGDTVWTVDIRVNRISLFDRDGNLLSSGTAQRVAVPLPATAVGYLLPWSMRPDGKFTSHFGSVAYNPNASPSNLQPTDSIPVPMLLFDATGEVSDTIGWADRPPPRMWRPPSQDDTQFESVQVGGRRMMVPSPPTAMPWWEPLLDGYLLIETPLAHSLEGGVVMVSRIGLAGDTVYSRQLDYRPAAYTGADLDSIAAWAARGAPGGMVPIASSVDGSARAVPENWETIARSLRGAMNFPEFQMPISYPRVGQDEAVWLRRSNDSGGVARWVLLDDRAAPWGELDLPTNVRILWSRGDTFWAAVPDEFDVPWVVRYRIERS